MAKNGSNPATGTMTFREESDLVAFANRFAGGLTAPLVVWLEGDLGTGKTTFVRALVHALGHEGRVKSPTYTLLEQYPAGRFNVLHMDLYRIGDPDELEFLGLADLLDDNTVFFVEWPERGGDWLPKPDYIFRFGYASQGRDLTWTAAGNDLDRTAPFT